MKVIYVLPESVVYMQHLKPEETTHTHNLKNTHESLINL